MPRVLIAYDSDTDPWRHHAYDIKRFGPSNVSVTTMSTSRLAANPPETYDSILRSSWADTPPAGSPRVGVALNDHGCEFSRDDVSLSALATCSFMNCKEAARRLLPKVNYLLAVNWRLEKVGQQYCGETYHCPLGINTEIFYDATPLPSTREKLIVGWRETPRRDRHHSELAWIYSDVFQACREFCTFREWPFPPGRSYDREQLARWYNQLDLLLYTPSTAGYPQCVYEAMACGRPIISTSVGDLPDLVCDNAAGYLVGDYHDRPSSQQVIEKVCRRLAELAADRRSLCYMGRNAFRLAQAYSWDRLAPRWLDYIVGIC
jgi:hypothetical protein